MKNPASLLPVIGLVFLFAAAQAYAAPNLSGEWKLNTTKSNYGSVPKPEVMVRKIIHSEPAVTISTFQKGQQGEVTTELKYTTDGKICVNKVQGGEAKGTASWQGEKLVIESSRMFQGTELRSKEAWTLSSDGKTLTIATHVTVPQNEFDVTLVFEKQ